MKKFLLIQSRPETEVSNDEYREFMQYGNLKPEEVERVRAEHNGLPENLHLDNFAAVIIGGGPYNMITPEDEKSDEQKKFESQMMKLFDEIVARDFPCLGACYGIGLATAHQGGIVSSKYGEEVAVIDITLTKEGASDPLLQNIPQTFKALVGHKEACEVLPKSATLLASSEHCPVQIMRFGKNIYITQFHPEIDAQGIKERVTAYRDHGYFPPEEAENLIENLSKEDLSVPWQILANFTSRFRS